MSSSSTAADETTTAVHRSIAVEVGQERAFEVFTEGFDSWWIRSHHIGAAEMDTAVIEPRSGGRWYERGVDGTECDWGYVIAWEPPERLVLVWQINGQWQFDPALVTEVEVTFRPDGDARTHVDLVHRHLERLGDAATQIRTVFESEAGWPGLLQRFAASAESA
ncbi:MAG: ATPase [Nitriliruptorales bacterium]|nr:ATPase [Nitriliruptorales bacterium]